MNRTSRILAPLCVALLLSATAAVAQAPNGAEEAAEHNAVAAPANAPEATGYAAQRTATETWNDEGFVPAVAGEAETVNGGALLMAAYAALWLLVLGYAALVSRRNAALANELNALRRRLQDIDDQLEELEG